MGVIRVENQAVKLYESTETLFNDKTSVCEWHLDYSNLATCDDTSDILLDTTVLATNLQSDGTFDVNETGTATSTTANQLRDAGASFLSTVTVGMIARNTTGDTVATITSVDSNIQLTLSADIFTSTDDYSLTWYEMTGGMDITTGQLVQTGGTAGTALQDALTDKNLLYKAEIDVTSFVSTVPGDQIRFKIGDITVLTLDETTVNTGSFVMSGFNTASVYDNFEIDCDAGISATFDNLVISKYSNVIFYILDCDTDAVVYYSLVSDVESSITQDQIKVTVDWSNVADGYTCDGCYYIAIVEDVDFPTNIGGDRITNGVFKLDTDWTKGTGWTIFGGQASVSTPTPAGTLSQLMSRSQTFSSGICYDITFDVVEYGEGEFIVELSNAAGGFTLQSGTYSANGTYTWNTGILGSISFDTISFVPTIGITQVFKLDNVTAFINVSCTGYKYRTDCFALADSFDCTVKLSGTNNDNAFGIDFVGLSYSPFVRVPGELMNAIYEGDKENEEDSAGLSKTLYFKSEKKRELFLYQLPEHLHDFIRLLIGYDTFLIDGVGYISDGGNYAPESERVLSKLPDLANSTTELRLQNDLNKNTFC